MIMRCDCVLPGHSSSSLAVPRYHVRATEFSASLRVLLHEMIHISIQTSIQILLKTMETILTSDIRAGVRSRGGAVPFPTPTPDS